MSEWEGRHRDAVEQHSAAAARHEETAERHDTTAAGLLEQGDVERAGREILDALIERQLAEHELQLAAASERNRLQLTATQDGDPTAATP